MDIEEHYDKIYRFCYYKLQSKELAEDLTQETFLRFLDSEYREQGMCIRYLYTIARNLCIEAYRKNKWDELPDDISDEGTEADNIVDIVFVRQALSKLSDEDRELLIMRYMNGETISDICEITGSSRFALYRKLKKAKKEFEKLVEGGFFGE